MNLEASLHPLLSFAWTLTRPANYLRQNIVFSYSEMSFFFLIISLFFVFYVILLLLIFTKTMLLQEPSWLLLSFYLINFFFMKITFKFSCSGMFQDVSACSGMFRNVLECSMFRVLSTPSLFQGPQYQLM